MKKQTKQLIMVTEIIPEAESVPGAIRKTKKRNDEEIGKRPTELLKELYRKEQELQKYLNTI